MSPKNGHFRALFLIKYHHFNALKRQIKGLITSKNRHFHTSIELIAAKMVMIENEIIEFCGYETIEKGNHALHREVRAMRRELCAVESEVRRLRCDKLDNLITSMQQSAREMLRLSRDL